MAEKLYCRYNLLHKVPGMLQMTIQQLMDELCLDGLPKTATTFANWTLGKMNWENFRYLCNFACLPAKLIIAPESQPVEVYLIPKELWKHISFCKRRFVDNVLGVFDRSKTRVIENTILTPYTYVAFIHYDLSNFSVEEILSIANAAGLYLFDYLIDNNVQTESDCNKLAERAYFGALESDELSPLSKFIEEYEIMSMMVARYRQENYELRARNKELEKKKQKANNGNDSDY